MNKALAYLCLLVGCDRFFQLDTVALRDAVHVDDAGGDAIVLVDALDASKPGIDGRDPIDALDAMIDAPPCPGIAGCGVVLTTRCGTVCFATCSSMTSEANAAMICQSSGAHLAKFETLQEEQCARGNNGRVWMGLVQDPPDIGPVPDDNWRWEDGSTTVYSNWLSGQPDDGDGMENSQENCAESTASGWVDSNCTTQLPFVCRF